MASATVQIYVWVGTEFDPIEAKASIVHVFTSKDAADGWLGEGVRRRALTRIIPYTSLKWED